MLCLDVLTYYKAHPGCVTKEKAFLQNLVAIVHVHPDEGDHDTGKVHLDVSHPERRV